MPRILVGAVQKNKSAKTKSSDIKNHLYFDWVENALDRDAMGCI